MKKKYVGLMGEEACAVYLRDEGYRILSCNYRTRFGEIDIIAQKDEIIAFVEVKTRNEASIAEPKEFVDSFKQSRIINTAMIYMSTFNSDLQPRFDVMEVTYDKVKNRIIDIKHITDAYGG